MESVKVRGNACSKKGNGSYIKTSKDSKKQRGRMSCSPDGGMPGSSKGCTTQGHIYNYIYMKDCHAVQIGDGNQVNYPVEEAQRLLDKTSDSFNDLTKNEILIGMLNSILNPNLLQKPPGVPLAQVRGKFEQIYGRSFETYCSLKLDLFIEKNKTWFEKYEVKQRTMIRPIIRTKKKKKDDFSRSSTEVMQDLLELHSEAETEYLTADTSSDVDDSFIDIRSSFSSEIDSQSSYLAGNDSSCQEADESDSDNTWIEVKKKNKPRRQTSAKVSTDVTSKENLSEEKVSLLKSLIRYENGDKVIFRPCVEFYLNNPCELMLDLVSLWNTPGLLRSHIVIGVDGTGRVCGLKSSISKDLLDGLFRNDLFTSLPVYQYFEVKWGMKLFGIVEISSSYGMCIPSITKASYSHNGRKYFKRDQMWYIENRERKALHLSDPNVAMIYQWFSGQTEPQNKNVGSKQLVKTSSDKRGVSADTKDASTSMSKRHITDSRTLEKAESFYTDKDSPKRDDQPSGSKLLETLYHFKKGRHILVAGDLPSAVQHQEAILLVPWLAVFDFDITSRDGGLLNANEDFMSKRRSLHVVSWSSPLTGIAEDATVWTFPRGRRDDPSSRLPVSDESDLRKWSKKVKPALDRQIEQIQKFVEDYTTLTILILWPMDESLCPFMNKFLDWMDNAIDPPPRLVMCLPEQPKTEIGKSVLSVLQSDQGDNLSIVNTGYNDAFRSIREEMKERHTIGTITHRLPTADDCNALSIDEKEASWLREEMEILYLDNPYAKAQIDVTALSDETENFYRGGTLHWFSWYECGAGHFDVERDILHDVSASVEKHLAENKSGIINLYHAPGSGGTTLAQRVLWDFHTKTPSVHVKLRSSLPTEDLVGRVELISERTHKPVLLLIDGEDESKVKFLLKMLRARCTAVILYVKRFPYQPNKLGSRKKLYLKGEVSKAEAKRLTLKFRDRCAGDVKKIRTLESLCEKVAEGEQHYLYEFGLATYQYEFKGLEAYVKGYLDIDTECRDGIKPWQKCLVFLSLAYYYGQSSLPMQFFTKMFHHPPNYSMEMSDFPHPVSEFVVRDLNENKRDNIRICHYLVAKEILEQLLSKVEQPTERSSSLSCNARKCLGEHCNDLIEYSTRKSFKSGTISHVLTRTFIFRDNRDMGENAEQTRRKPVLSRLMSDIPSRPPLFTERLQILQKLTEAFPNDPNFHAHLGRFYACCRPDDEDKVEACFNKALELCERQIAGKATADLDDRLLLSLMHIYHMYGTVLQKRIARFTGFSPTDEPENEIPITEFESSLETILRLGKASCKYFHKCRDYSPPGHETSWGYVGEIMVRLQICDFVHRKFVGEDANGIHGYIAEGNNQEAREFVRKSIYKIDNLLMECYNTFEEDDLDKSTQKYIFWYNYLFSSHCQGLEDLAQGDDVNSYRLRITAKKLKYGTNQKNLTLLDNISSPLDIHETIELYENIFREIHTTGVKEGKNALDRDYQEWLHAIRHPMCEKMYSKEDVLLHLRRWNDHVKTPMSKFYVFVVLSLLGFGEDNTNGRTENLIDAEQLRKELSKLSKFVLRPRYPREWLGLNGGIRCLVPGTRFIGHMIDERNLRDEYKDTRSLKICKGTICPPNNKKLSGYIDLDLGNNVVPVRVFYIPLTAKLASPAYASSRVEFKLAFSLDHGYEAFNVRVLQKFGCVTTGCSGKLEMTTTMNQGKCPRCSSTIYRNDLQSVS